jgi:RHS repeat-associated protein
MPQALNPFPPNPTAQDITYTRLFEEPLVPIGAEPGPAENAALVAALLAYANRSSPDDVSSLTGFLDAHPRSAWNAALLTNLGLEFYNTGYYSRALEAWNRAWALAQGATDLQGKALADRAVGEFACMLARVGRMGELEALLETLAHRAFRGAATERIAGAREGLWNMRNRPEIAFRCGPLALHCVALFLDPRNTGADAIRAAQSTQDGVSLAGLADLAHTLGPDYRMAFREHGAEFVVPSVVHLRLDHSVAIVRREGNRYLLRDHTFRQNAWLTQAALDAETSGYCLLPPGHLPHGWREVGREEGAAVWGKGITTSNDPDPHAPCDPASPEGACTGEYCQGLAVPRVHLMLVSLNINDEPVGYSPPVGPAVRFTVRYNQRDAKQPGNFTYSNFGPKWTFDWLSYITDNPASPLADVTYYIMGGGTRTFTGFDPRTQSYASQQFDQTRLTRTSPGSYELVSRDGSRMLFDRSDGTISTTRKVFLTSVIDPFGNAVSLTYDATLRMVAITDAIGQVTAITYENPTDFKIKKVTDPFERFASFEYDNANRLVAITDVHGLTSRFTYDGGDFVTSLTTPYGVTTFTKSDDTGNMRFLETVYPDGERDRVEFNQFTATPDSDEPDNIPAGMATLNEFLSARNTFYWDKQACAYAYGDYAKARIYHWLHENDHTICSGILERVKEPLEGRVWHDYADQTTDLLGPVIVGSTNQPSHIGRVLDDGSTQIYAYEYNGFGNVTRSVDPVGRTFTSIYADNGIDLLEVRQTRAGQSELLSRMTYNAQHLPLTVTDAAGQTTSYTYNDFGQVLSVTNALGETTTHEYDAHGYRQTTVDALGGRTTFTYDAVGRMRTKTDVSGYTLTYDYDPLDRITSIGYPDSTSDAFEYTLLDLTLKRDRAGRETSFEYDSVRQMTQRTDPMGRITRFRWCKCGALKAVTDPMGRTTTWRHDIQGRVKCKEYADGSKVTYRYERTTSRLKQRIDEKLQVTDYTYTCDDMLSGKSYSNTEVATPSVLFTYDPNYNRMTSMTDANGTTRYRYAPITPVPALGAGELASEDAPLPGHTVTYGYDALGRRVSTAIDGAAAILTLDAIGRVAAVTNALGQFGYEYDGSSERKTVQTYPNGQRTNYGYGSVAEDNLLQRITNGSAGGVSGNLSEFVYAYDLPAGRITSWSQQQGTAEPAIYALGYDDLNRLTSAVLSQGTAVLNTLGYNYDPLGNRLSEQIDGAITHFSYNVLNEVTSSDIAGGEAASYSWDAEQRLVSIASGNTSTLFTYDGLGRCVAIRRLINGSNVSERRFVWCGVEIREERTLAGLVSKRFFEQGMQADGPSETALFYTRDHLGSIRELTDAGGAIRARYVYDPFGRATRVQGDTDADFGFAGMFRSIESDLNLTWRRAYDPEQGRWLSRDLLHAELEQGDNLYVYVQNNPVGLVDPYGLSETSSADDSASVPVVHRWSKGCTEERAEVNLDSYARSLCEDHLKDIEKGMFPTEKPGLQKQICQDLDSQLVQANEAFTKCLSEQPPEPPPKPPPPKPPKPPNPKRKPKPKRTARC